MSLIDQIVARAKANKQRIVLPEAEEERTLIAADKVLEQDIADLILIGNPDKVAALAKQHNLKNLDKATLIDPENYERSEELAQLLQKLREKKGMTIEKARESRLRVLTDRFQVHSQQLATLCAQRSRLSRLLLASLAFLVLC